MNNFDCEECRPKITKTWKQFFREVFCIHHFVFFKNAYLRHECHKCGLSATEYLGGKD